MEKNNKKEDSRRFVTPEFRVAFPHVFKPSSVQGSDQMRYSVTMLFKKNADLSRLKLAMKHAKIEEWGPDQSKWPKISENPVKDGDGGDYDQYEGFKGHFVIGAHTKEEWKPEVVGPDVEPILSASEFYPGCYAKASVFCRAWTFGKKAGVSFYLNAVQKTRDGERMGGTRSAKETFSPIEQEFGDEGDSDDIEDDDNF